MELYGSLFNISGSVTASAFTGSFNGDGGGLYNLPASGVTGLNLSQIASGNATASISSSGFTVNKSTQIQGDLSVTGSIIATNYIVSSSVTYMTTSFASGSSMFGNDGNDVHQFTGSVQITGSISLNGQAIGTGKLDETTFQSYTSSNDSRVSALETSSGSLNSFTSSIDTTIKSKLNTENVISGSVQVDISGTTGYSTFSSSLTSSIGSLSSSIATTTSGLSSSIDSLSSSVATTTLNTKNRVDSIENKTGSYATTGSNLFIGTQTHSGSILPSVDNAYDLGSPTYQWRDVYISSGSLYIDGTKVISSTAQELTITTDTGQSIKILESTTDSIILQVADGDIELKSSGDGDILLDPTNGKIMLKGTVEILNGQKIQSSVGGTPVVFANDIVVSGSIDITGTIEGINLTDFSSSVNTRVSNLESGAGSLNSFTASANNRLNSLESTSGSLNSFTSSATSRLSSIETTTGSLNSYTSSNNTRLSSIETTTSSILGVNTTQNSRLDSLETTSGSILTTNTAQSGRLDSIEGKSGSYATTGSNIFQGDQTITGSLYISQNLIIAGSSSIQNISSSVLNIADNIITVNAINPSVRFGGLAVIDSGSSPQVSGSMLFDSVNNQWLFVHQNQGTVTSSVLLMGPETYNNLGNETYITSNRLVKSTGIENLTNSNISDDGTTVTILSNAVVNGTFSATGTTLVSGSSQITHDSTTGYVANRHIDHTSVSISAGNGLSGGGDISTTRTITLDTASATFTSGVKSKMSADGVVSGSSQVSFNGITDKPTLVSGSSQITYGSLSSIPAGIVSGSSQITFGSISSIPGGLVSGSAQVDLTATTNYSTGIKTRLNAEGVFSGSAQVTGIGNAQLTNSSFFVGTTSISLGRASASQTLTGVNVDGTAGSISGFNNPATAATANTIVYRDGSGDIYSRYAFSSYVNSTDDVSAGTITYIMAKFGDNYYRSATAAKVQSFLGLGSLAYSSATIPTNNNQLTNGAGYITSDSTKLPLAGGTMTGTITITNTDIRSNSTSNWTGDPGTQGKIQYHASRWYIVADSASDRIVQFRRNGTDVSYIDNSGNFIGNASTATTATSATSATSATTAGSTGTLSSNAVTSGYLVIGGNYSSNAYNAIAGGTRLMFGGGDADAQGNYYIGTNMEDVGGNYNKLDLRWHTGIRMGAQAGYGGIRFFNNEDLSSVLFSIGNTDGNVRSHTNLIPSANNSYNLGGTSNRWANIYTNDLHLSNEGKEGGNEIDGTTGDWTIQEGEENLYIINHKNGKKFKIDLTEIV